MIYNGDKIIPGLILFLGLITFPVWYIVVNGKAAPAHELKIVIEAMEPTPYKRAKHMDLLQEWRESVVRQGSRKYIASDGKEYDMSLTGTCMNCHKKEFCDRCHDYIGVKPNCWSCHNYPGSGK